MHTHLNWSAHKHRITGIVIGILSLIFLAPTVYASDPWWLQGYDISYTTETNFSYGGPAGGAQQIQASDESIRFFDEEPLRYETLSKQEKALYDALVTYATTMPAAQKEDQEKRLNTLFPHSASDLVETVIQLYEFNTMTGWYTYLREMPAERTIKIYDAWFSYFWKKHPLPPERVSEYEKTLNEALETTAKKFNIRGRDVKRVVFRIQKYQEKYALPRGQLMKESLPLLKEKMTPQ